MNDFIDMEGHEWHEEHEGQIQQELDDDLEHFPTSHEKHDQL